MNLFERAIEKLHDIVQAYVDRRGVTRWSERMDGIIDELITAHNEYVRKMEERHQDIMSMREAVKRWEILLNLFAVPWKMFDKIPTEILEKVYRERALDGRLVRFPDLFLDELYVDVMIAGMARDEILNTLNFYREGNGKLREILRDHYRGLTHYFDLIDRGIEPDLVLQSANSNYYAGNLNTWEAN